MKNKFFKVFFLMLVCIIMLSAYSCTYENNEKSPGTVTFTDALGREVSVKKQPKRAAALLGSFADIWVLSGGELCAAAEDAWEDFALELGDAVNIGGAHSPSLELLISANPDFVIASASTASNVEMKDTLEAMNIPVAYFDVDNFKDYLNMLSVCTDITGRKDLYEKNGTELKLQIDAVKSQYAGENIPEEKRKILLLRTSSSFVKAKGSRGTILGEMLADMGCINIADNNANLLENLSAEAVIEEEPYHIFVVTMGSNTDKAMASLENMIKENPAWGTLEAVKGGRLHVMDKTLFNLKPNARFAEAYKVLYEKLTENNIALIYLAAAVLLLASFVLGILLGAADISFYDMIKAFFSGDMASPEARILVYVRLPRVLASLACGAAFAVSGAVIQCVLANKLASPGIIGVNAGAGLAVTLCSAFGIIGGFKLSLFAFFGAFLTVILVSLGAKKWGASEGTVITDTVTTFVPEAAIMSNDFKIGDFSSVTYAKLAPAALIIIIVAAVLLTLSNELDVLTLGDENAKGLGLNTGLMRPLFLLFSALLAGAAVSVAGLLSFVGLIVPHAVRRIATPRARHLLPLCALFGAGFVSLCDTLARIALAPYELPVGIIMAFIGAPFFIFILIKGKGGNKHD